MSKAKDFLENVNEAKTGEFRDANFKNLSSQANIMKVLLDKKPDMEAKEKESLFGSLLLLAKAAMKGEDLHAQAEMLTPIIKKLK